MSDLTKSIFRETDGGTWFACLCVGGLSFACIASFALAYLVVLAPVLTGLGSIEEARLLFNSVCMTLPYAFDDMLAPALGSLLGGS